MTDRKLRNLAERIRQNRISRKDKDMIDSLFFCYEDEIPSNLDYIVVFTSSELWHIKTAIRVYHRRRCKIIISGGSILEDGQKECKRYFDYARMREIPKEDLICDEFSTNISQKIFSSFSIMLQKGLWKPRILFLASPHHLYRISKTIAIVCKKLYYFPECFYYPSPPRNYRRERWFLYAGIREEFALELERIVQYHLLDVEEFDPNAIPPEEPEELLEEAEQPLEETVSVMEELELLEKVMTPSEEVAQDIVISD